MKYNELKVKEKLTADEYFEFVYALVNIQLSENEDGTFRYQPEHLSMTLPSILAHICIDGIEWDEDEKVMYDDVLVQKIMDDEHLWGVIQTIMPLPDVWEMDAPYYLQMAMSDAEKKVKFVLDNNRPADQFANAIVAILGDLSKIGELMQTDNGKAILEAVERLAQKNENNMRPQNRQQRRKRK